MMFTPVAILRIEGAAMLAFGIAGFAWSDASWWWFALLILAPDLSMVGYLASPVTGAFLYNLGHAIVAPAVLFGWAWAGDSSVGLALGSVWLAHVGMDRLFGFGLKFADDFKHTHLGWIGGEP